MPHVIAHICLFTLLAMCCASRGATLAPPPPSSVTGAGTNRYDVTDYPNQTLSVPIQIPAEIVGSLPEASSKQSVVFQLASESQEVPVAIYTHSGTGATFKATLIINSGEMGYSVAITGTPQTVIMDDFSYYELVVESDAQFMRDAKYAVRIGTFDPITVSFDGNGGDVSADSETYQPGKPYGTFPSATWAGHDFTGWSTDDGIVLSTNTVVCVGYTNLLAQWTQSIEPSQPTNIAPSVTNYTVNFIANGGKGSMTTQTFTYGEAKALSTNLFTRTAYVFDGWAASATGKVTYVDCEVVSNLTKEVDGTVPLYAKWTRMTNAYDVAFYPNQGQGTMDTQGLLLDVPQELETNQFVRVGYDFTGWAMSPSGEVVYADHQIVTNVTTNAGTVVSLYAQWAMTPLPIQSNTVNGVTWYFTATNGMATIIRRNGTEYVVAVEPQTMSDLVVPDVLTVGTNVNVVTAIGANAFMGLVALTNVVMPASVTGMATRVFAGCGKIVSATLPMVESMQSIMPDSYSSITHVSVPGTAQFLDVDIPVCANAFLNCTALTSVSLPLGVKELSASAFDGCTALSSFEMPYTVTTIGARAFAGCTSLKTITVTESVKSIGENAFTDCSALKIVRYLGDEPEAATGGEGNIYYHSNSALVSGYLPEQRSWSSGGSWDESEVQTISDVNDDGDDDNDRDYSETSDDNSKNDSDPATTTVYTYNAVSWPSGGSGRPLLKWNNTMYKHWKVTLNYNNGGKTQPTELVYVDGRVVGELPKGESELDFVGWFTERYGGVEVSPYTVVNSPMTFYAHWSGEGSGNGTRGIVNALSAFYDSGDFSYEAATFSGLLIDGDTVAGTIQVKTKKGRHVAAANGMNSSFTATMQVMGERKTSLSGVVDADGTAEVENERGELSLSLDFSQFGLSGSYSTENGSYTIIAARDRYSAGSDDAKATVRVALGHARKKRNAVLVTAGAEGEGAELASGYSILSFNIGATGRASIRGTMADGTKVSASSKLIVGDSCCCLPVIVPLYNKKGGFSFALWFTWTDDGSDCDASIVGLSGWNARSRSESPFEATFGDAILGVPYALGEVSFHLDGFFSVEGADDSFSPDGTIIDASTSLWKLPKSNGVRFVKYDGWTTIDGRDYGNPAGLKLSYSYRTGLFKGSFKVFCVTGADRAKKYTATVSGAVINGTGYGTATIKKVGSLPVKVE